MKARGMAQDAFNEGDHPRDHGKFTSGGGSGGSEEDNDASESHANTMRMASMFTKQAPRPLKVGENRAIENAMGELHAAAKQTRDPKQRQALQAQRAQLDQWFRKSRTMKRGE